MTMTMSIEKNSSYLDKPVDATPQQPQPSSTTMNYMGGNPLSTGVQFGLAGAAGGLGYAALQRAVRLHAGNESQVDILKPMLIGTLIGSTLGLAGSLTSRKPSPKTWFDLSEQLRAGGFQYPMYKTFSTADEPLEKQGFVLTTGTIIALIFAAMSARGAGDQLGQASVAAQTGNKRKALLHGLGAAGEVAMAYPGVGILGRAGQTALRTGKGGRLLKSLATGGKGLLRPSGNYLRMQYEVPAILASNAAPWSYPDADGRSQQALGAQHSRMMRDLRQTRTDQEARSALWAGRRKKVTKPFTNAYAGLRKIVGGLGNAHEMPSIAVPEY